MWEGTRVLAHLDMGRSTADGTTWCLLVDDEGTDLTEFEVEVVGELRDAFRAFDAVVDGYLTDQATRPGTEVSLAGIPRKSGNIVMGRRVETDVSPRPDTEGPRRVAFVAVDLLRVDGQDLFDVPLLERKRILDSLLEQTDLVRVSPYTQPPLKNWLQTWKAAGFRGAMVKAANSRYVPGHETDDWTTALASETRR